MSSSKLSLACFRLIPWMMWTIIWQKPGIFHAWCLSSRSCSNGHWRAGGLDPVTFGGTLLGVKWFLQFKEMLKLLRKEEVCPVTSFILSSLFKEEIIQWVCLWQFAALSMLQLLNNTFSILLYFNVDMLSEINADAQEKYTFVKRKRTFQPLTHHKQG